MVEKELLMERLAQIEQKIQNFWNNEQNEELINRMRGEEEICDDSFENEPNQDVEYQLMAMLDRARTLKNEVVLQRGIVKKVVKENEKMVL